MNFDFSKFKSEFLKMGLNFADFRVIIQKTLLI